MKTLFGIFAILATPLVAFADYYSYYSPDIEVTQITQSSNGMIQATVCNDGENSTGYSRLTLVTSVNSRKVNTTNVDSFILDVNSCKTVDIGGPTALKIRSAGSYSVRVSARITGGNPESSNENNTRSTTLSVGEGFYNQSTNQAARVDSLFGNSYKKDYYLPATQNSEYYYSPVYYPYYNPSPIRPQYIVYPTAGIPDFSVSNVRYVANESINGTYYQDAVVADVCNNGDIYRGSTLVSVSIAINGGQAVVATIAPYTVQDWPKNECRPAIARLSLFPNITSNSYPYDVSSRVDPSNVIPESNEANNEVIKSVTLSNRFGQGFIHGYSSLPDLVVTTLRTNGTYVDVQVCNNGNGITSQSFRLDLRNETNGQTYSKTLSSGISQGQCVWSSFDAAYTQGYTSNLYRAVVDSYGSINESNETNNALSSTLVFGTTNYGVYPNNNSYTNTQVDLEIASVSTIGNSGLADVSICNRGSTGNGQISVPLSATMSNGETLTNTYVLNNSGYGCSTVTVRIPLLPYNMTSSILRITLDPNNSISEFNESNNSFQISVVRN